MKTTTDPHSLYGATVLGSDGDKLGKVEEVYLDNDTDRAEWAAVKTGLFGGNVSLVPLAQAQHDGESLRVPYAKAQLKDAPRHDPGQELSEADEAELYRHYGLGYSERRSDSLLADGTTAGTTGAVGRETSGPQTDDAMTRSEEQLRVGTERREAGRARLRKYVVTENVTKTVPVSHEEVRVERESITEANRDQALDGPAISEEEHEVVLHEERPVVRKEAVPVERVRLATETVTGEETVNEELRKERIEQEAGPGAREV